MKKKLQLHTKLQIMSFVTQTLHFTSSTLDMGGTPGYFILAQNHEKVSE